jgi:hypothetical protein
MNMRIPFDFSRFCGKRSLLVVCFCALGLLIGADEAWAQRRGFVLNLGLGAAWTSLKPTGFPGPSENKRALGSEFKIGYAPSDNLMIYYSNDAAFFGFNTDPDEAELFTATGMSGVGGTYFLRTGVPSLFVHASVGLAALRTFYSDDTEDSWSGGGVSFGGGFEFARHWTIDVDFLLTSVSDEFDNKLSIRTARLAFNWLLY